MDYHTFNNYQAPEPVTGVRYSYGDFKLYRGEVTDEEKKGFYILPDLLCGGDYSGAACTRSNHRVFLRDFEHIEGVYDLYGGYGTYAIAIRADVAEENEDIKEILDSLESNSPAIDEEDVMALEQEWAEAAMKDVVSDLIRSINLDDYLPEGDYDEDIEAFASEGIEDLGLEWTYENTSAYMDTKHVQPYVEDRLLIKHCTDMPLLITRKWCCDITGSLYEQKLKGV